MNAAADSEKDSAAKESAAVKKNPTVKKGFFAKKDPPAKKVDAAEKDSGARNARKYNPERLMTLLLAPVVSEKGTFIADKHEQVIFHVVPDATKPEIKAAVELMWKVDVESVQIANVKGKEKRFGRFVGRRRDWKKAYVCLKAGQEINFAQDV